ncbi:MAG: hypothetical protein NTU62_08645, partial [Spirochaetes bacterium]|nr:hypothetical protein [Spirochaetota bacterium]
MMHRIISVILLTFVAVSGAAGSSGTAGAGPKPDITLFGALGSAPGGASLYFSTREEFVPNGSIRILVKQGDGWQLAARVAEDEHLRTREIYLSTGKSTGDLVIRLEPEAPGASHLDSVTVDGCAPRGLDARLARKLSAADNDVVPFSDIAGVELRFAAGRKAKLAISARVEPAVLGTLPAAYPAANVHREVAAFSSFYTYRIGSRPWSPVVDGSLSTEQLNAPLFRESLPLGSGHPESPTYGWIGDDGRYLYAALDTTADNTLDPGKDYARLHLKTAAGIRTFEVTTNLVTWGRSGFEYTDRVGWEHKVYEMAIPLDEIGAVAGSELELAFTVYGTLGTQIYWSTDPNGVDPDSGASGDTFTFTVK